MFSLCSLQVHNKGTFLQYMEISPLNNDNENEIFQVSTSRVWQMSRLVCVLPGFRPTASEDRFSCKLAHQINTIKFRPPNETWTYSAFNSLHAGEFRFFLHLQIFFIIYIFKKSLRNAIRVSNSLDPDQARHFVGPDLGPNCLLWLSANSTGS